MSSSAFIPFWLCDRPRDTFLSYVPKDDLRSLRLACYDFSVRAAPHLFKEITVTFRENIFTKPVRMAALGRIGQHVQTLKFTIPHSAKTFLPPLVDTDGVEVAFIYEPYIGSTKDPIGRHSIPTYGSWEMNDLLVKQYPPLFHDAAKVSAFIQTFSAIPNLRHLEVSCPGQPPEERQRRSVVDYALISLRIAVERSNLSHLETLSLLPIHPGAVQYLNPSMGFGVNPRSTKCWRQIRRLNIHMDTIESGSPVDHLKSLHGYLQNFAPFVTEFNFRWQGVSENKGPCPVSLATENCIQATSRSHECDKRCKLPLPCLRFGKLRDIEIMNIFPDSPQIKGFIRKHRRTLESLKLNGVKFRLGDWDDALSPLTEISGSEKWKETAEEFIDVPLMLSPAVFEQERRIRAWNDHVKTRTSSSKPLQGALHRASAKGKELFFGTEEHMHSFPSSSAFDAINSSLQSDDAERKDAVKKGNAVFAFTLKNKEGQSDSWYIDLKEKGEVAKGEAPSGKKADGQYALISELESQTIASPTPRASPFCEREYTDQRATVTLSLSDDDFAKLVSGKTQAQRLFMSGKLKIRGDVMKATKMEPVLKKAQTKAKL